MPPEANSSGDKSSSLKFVQNFSQLGNSFGAHTEVQPLKDCETVLFNREILSQCGSGIEGEEARQLLNACWGSALDPVPGFAMVYSGHQFGNWAGTLGDGRGVCLGDLALVDASPLEVHLKGSGPTPFARGFDGRATFAASIREYVIGEFLHALDVPTTRSLALFSSSETVEREGVPKAIGSVARVARSHVRIGHFEHFAVQKDHDSMHKLMHWCFERLWNDTPAKDRTPHHFLTKVVMATAHMVADWQAVGFAHGVLNTDNFAISGETLDFGPFGFMGSYEPDWTPNTSDFNGRYTFAAQPEIGLWNCTALAQALTEITEAKPLSHVLQNYGGWFLTRYLERMCRRLGLAEEENNWQLIRVLLQLLHKESLNYNRALRVLAEIDGKDDIPRWKGLFSDEDAAGNWLRSYTQAREESEISRDQLLQCNPAWIPSNTFLASVIDRVDAGDTGILPLLADALQDPFNSPPDLEIPWEKQPHSLSCAA